VDAPAVFDISCVAYVHTTYSDGTATVSELLAAAREAGAEAVLLTDHDSLGARRDGWEGAHDGVFLLVARRSARSRATTSSPARASIGWRRRSTGGGGCSRTPIHLR
jgi:hypothetical protein